MANQTIALCVFTTWGCESSKGGASGRVCVRSRGCVARPQSLRLRSAYNVNSWHNGVPLENVGTSRPPRPVAVDLPQSGTQRKAAYMSLGPGPAEGHLNEPTHAAKDAQSGRRTVCSYRSATCRRGREPFSRQHLGHWRQNGPLGHTLPLLVALGTEPALAGLQM